MIPLSVFLDGGIYISDICPIYAPFFGAMGVASALVFTVVGAAYGTAKSSVGISNMGVLKPDLVMRAIIPVIFAGALAVYGLIIAVILNGKVSASTPGTGYPLKQGFTDLAAGLTVGLCGMASGMSIGIIGDSGVRGFGQQPKLYVGMVLVLIFAEALGLFGLIIGLLLGSAKAGEDCAFTVIAATKQTTF